MVGERVVDDVLAIMRRALGRRNANDPDSSDSLFFQYINDFVTLKMPNDTKLFESFGTLSFTINDDTDGVYTFNQVGADTQFMNISQEAFISLKQPERRSISWNRLPIYQDPGEFYDIWGVNNEDVLVRGYPTMMLYYDNQFVFRTIPQADTDYIIKIYGYKKNDNFPRDENGVPITGTKLPFDYWLRYIAYGASVDYARDYRYSPEARSLIEATFKSERKDQLTHAHNQMKMSRAMPRF